LEEANSLIVQVFPDHIRRADTAIFTAEWVDIILSCHSRVSMSVLPHTRCQFLLSKVALDDPDASKYGLLSSQILRSLPSNLKGISFRNFKLTSEEIRNEFQRFTQLVGLGFRFSEIDDETLMDLINIRGSLTELNLGGVRTLTTKSLSQLTKLTALTSLSVCTNGIVYRSEYTEFNG
jgi:hypothetical protein